MSVLKGLLERVAIRLKTAQYSLKQVPFVYTKKIPYFSQWESTELVDRLLSKKISAVDDPKWRQSGAVSKHEYLHWSWNSCGMACLKMVLADEFSKKFKIVELGKLCEKYGGYVTDEKAFSANDYLHSIDGLFYQPFVRFIKTEYGLDAVVRKILVAKEIMHELSEGNYVVVSVDPAIRNPSLKSNKKGGHLVLMTGYDRKKKLFYLNNPSGYYKKSQENASLSFKNFEKFFAHKGFVIYNP